MVEEKGDENSANLLQSGVFANSQLTWQHQNVIITLVYVSQTGKWFRKHLPNNTAVLPSDLLMPMYVKIKDEDDESRHKELNE